MPLLKPMTDFERKLAAALGEDPEAFRRSLLKPQAKASRSSEYDRRRNATATAEEIVAAFVEPRWEWRPIAYVMFKRIATCICGVETQSVDDPRVFLQSRRFPVDDTQALRYEPLKALSYGRLPRRFVVRPYHLLVCEACFTEAPTCKDSLKQDAIASAPSATQGTPPSSEPALLSSVTELSMLSTLLAASGGSSSSREAAGGPGSASPESSPRLLPVVAGPLRFPIEEELVAQSAEGINHATA